MSYELFKGYRKENSKRETNEFVAAHDFLNSDDRGFNVKVWYNLTYKDDTGGASVRLWRVAHSIRVSSNAYLQLLKGTSVEMPSEFVKEMPKLATKTEVGFIIDYWSTFLYTGD
jgi:hypothetical protein